MISCFEFSESKVLELKLLSNLETTERILHVSGIGSFTIELEARAPSSSCNSVLMVALHVHTSVVTVSGRLRINLLRCDLRSAGVDVVEHVI